MSTDPRTTDRRSPDLVSLIAGVVVGVIVLAFALGDLGTFDRQARVLVPTVLFGVGVALLATSRRR